MLLALASYKYLLPAIITLATYILREYYCYSSRINNKDPSGVRMIVLSNVDMKIVSRRI